MDLLLLLVWIAAACLGLLVLFGVAPRQARAAVNAVFPFEPVPLEPVGEEGVPAQELARRLGWASRSGRPHHQAVVLAAANEGLVDEGALYLAPLAEDFDVEHTDDGPRVRRVRYVTARYAPDSWEWWLAWTFTPDGAERMCALGRRYRVAVGEPFEIRANARAQRHGIGGHRVVRRVPPRELAVRVDPWVTPYASDDCETLERAARASTASSS